MSSRVVEFISGWTVKVHNEGTNAQYYAATKGKSCHTSERLSYLRKKLKQFEIAVIPYDVTTYVEGPATRPKSLRGKGL